MLEGLAFKGFLHDELLLPINGGKKKAHDIDIQRGASVVLSVSHTHGLNGKLHSELSTATRNVERGSPGWEGEEKLDWNAAQEFRNA